MGKKFFDYVIGNPPYQDKTIGDNGTYAPPIYDKFMDISYELADKVELIHPARFLFNAGSTAKSWNKKMLEDSHFKVIDYFEHSTDVFPNTVIKGGIVISYHDYKKEYGAIKIFAPYPELNNILKKVTGRIDFVGINTIMVTSYAYHFLNTIYEDFPQAKGLLSKGHEFDFKSNVFEKMDLVFSKNKTGNDCIRVLGRVNNKRIYRFISSKYINDVINLHNYKVFLPGAIGTGKYGETISAPIIGYPSDAATETFLSLGNFKSKNEAENAIKYIKTKFCRSLYGILKRTQANTPGKWKYVPLQNFDSESDIDWSKSIPEIDQRLYEKYGLNEKEINFIETHVKEMA